MIDALLCDAIRTPIAKLNGLLSGFRADDLAAGAGRDQGLVITINDPAR